MGSVSNDTRPALVPMLVNIRYAHHQNVPNTVDGRIGAMAFGQQSFR
jgi:hypothetical protein